MGVLCAREARKLTTPLSVCMSLSGLVQAVPSYRNSFLIQGTPLICTNPTMSAVLHPAHTHTHTLPIPLHHLPTECHSTSFSLHRFLFVLLWGNLAYSTCVLIFPSPSP